MNDVKSDKSNVKNARVSIIVPMYNASRYIIETLEGVRNQTSTDWELIIVDDGSIDSSGQIVEAYLSQHQGMGRLLDHPGKKNLGTSASRNLGLEHAHGELLCFLDADDVWDHNFLEAFTGLLDRYPQVSMAYGPALLWHADPGKDKFQRLGINAHSIVDPLLLFKLFLIGRADTPSPSGVIIRRQALARAGGWEATFRGMYDDQVLYSKLLLDGVIVYVTDQCLYRYRQHDKSLCHLAAIERREPESRKLYLEWLKRHLLEKGKLSEEISIILTEHFWYAQRRMDASQLTSRGWWSRKLSILPALMTLLAHQENFSTVTRLSWRILANQLSHAVQRARLLFSLLSHFKFTLVAFWC